MQIFYKKLLANGKLQKGISEFTSLQEAKMKLLETGDLILELKEINSKKTSPFSLEMKYEFTYQMYQLVSAGLPLYESLLSLKEKKVSYGNILDKLANSVKEGSSFSEAITFLKNTFDPLYVAIMKASEASGEIKEGFLSLKVLQERQIKIIKVLKSAFIYPSILLIFALIIVHGLVFFIIPSLSELFEGRTLEGLTRIILSVSRFAQDHVLMIAVSYMVLFVSMLFGVKSGVLKKMIMAFLKRIPFCYNLFLSLKFENFFTCLSQLLYRGINLKEALELSKNVLRQKDLEDVIETIKKDILKGKKFSESINEPFPQVAKRLISLSEETGKLAESCQMLSQIFSEDVEKRLHKLTTFLQPALLAIIGLIVGVVVLSILMPLTDVGGFL
jgi:general secretion pathway protein F